MKLKKLECKRCEYEWVARTEAPRVCPKCKSPYWNVPRRQVKSSNKTNVSKKI